MSRRRSDESPPFTRDKRPRPSFDRPGPPSDEEAEVLEDMGEGTFIVDQGDGMHVTVTPRARRSREDIDESECPSEPPPGWGDG